MTTVRMKLIRAGLMFFTSLCAVLGGVIVIWPDWFFGFSWVNLGMAENPHLLLDFGAKNLAMAVFLGGAALTMNTAFVRTALAAYSVWAVAHFLIHLHFRAHFVTVASAGEAKLLVAILALGAVVPVLLLALACVPPRPVAAHG